MEQAVRQVETAVDLGVDQPIAIPGVNVAGAIASPVTGFLWGAAIGAILSPKTKRWDTAVEAGMWAGGLNVIQTGIAFAGLRIPALRPLMYAALIPAPTIAAGYIGWKARQ
jgi:hypothetical protein